MSVSDLARLLHSAGAQQITPDAIRSDLAAGAPANADGTLHLVHYIAWLARQIQTTSS